MSVVAVDPRGAPPRPDLRFLLHRTKRVPASAPAEQAASYTRSPDPAPPPPVSSSLDLGPAPQAGTRLDLEPASQPAASLDRPPGPAQEQRAATSLDLGSAATTEEPRRSFSAPEPPRGLFPDVRVRPGTRTVMTTARPTVTLSRLQSGVGTLTIEAAVPLEVGDVHIGAAYEFGDRFASTVQLDDERFAPPGSRRPVLVASRDRYERIQIDLRQSTNLRRFIIYAFSGHRTPLAWSGTLTITTVRQVRVEVPLEGLGVAGPGTAAVLLSGYNVRGGFVLRGELQSVTGDVREAVRAFGFDAISWVDDRTPLR